MLLRISYLFLFISICSSQLISVKSVPLATGSQFDIYPSESFGMGGISIAFDDTYKDPFCNPVCGRKIQKSTVFCLPTFYTDSEQENFNKSLPVALLYRHAEWFSGFCLSLQEINNQSKINNMWWISSEKLSSRSRKNHYIHLFAGREVIKHTTYLAGSFFLSDLNAVDGIDYLYTNSTGIEMEGNIHDYRLGLSHIFENHHTVELLLLYHRFNMTHDVVYFYWPFDDTEKYEDHTNTWGGYLRYLYPFINNSWQIGSIMTMNYKTHPKIPNYDLMNIPRDPGDSYAYNFGIGIAKSTDSLRFGIDMIYEPIWSNTWAEALSNTYSITGKIIAPGEKTVINDFQFYNYHLRAGFGSQGRIIGIQLGITMRSVNYRLKQDDFILERKRNVEENWFEWDFTWGLLLKLSGFNFHYQGKVSYGQGRPGIDTNNRISYASVGMQSDIILAPAGDLTLAETAILTHRIMIDVPLE